MQETWKVIPSLNNLYSASTLGRIRRNRRSQGTRGDPLKPGQLPAGYLFVIPCVNGKPQNCRVHRLVLEAFKGPCPPGLCANHKDGDKTNNAPANLEWCSLSDNHKHRARVLKKGAVVAGKGHWNYHAVSSIST